MTKVAVKWENITNIFAFLILKGKLSVSSHLNDGGCWFVIHDLYQMQVRSIMPIFFSFLYHEWVLGFAKSFSASVGMITGFCHRFCLCGALHLLICISYNPGMKLLLSWPMILVMFFCIPFVNIFSGVCIYVLRRLVCNFLF